MKKYILTNNTRIVGSGDHARTLHQIKAINDFGNVKTGQVGGWIEKEENLSQHGNCWVDDDACVFEGAHVYGDAYVGDNVKVYRHAKVFDNASVTGCAYVYDRAEIKESSQVSGSAIIKHHACISGNAQIKDNAIIEGNAFIDEYAKVFERAKVSDNTNVTGHAVVHGQAEIYENARLYGWCDIGEDTKVYGYAVIEDEVEIIGTSRIYGSETNIGGCAYIVNGYISQTSHVLVIGKIGSRDDFTTFYRHNSSGEIYVKCGCFNNTIDKFLIAVEAKHGNNYHGQTYKALAEVAKMRIQGTYKKETEI